MNEKLLPCPFCGSDANISSMDEDGNAFLINCTNNNCGTMMTTNNLSNHKLIQQWNTRQSVDVDLNEKLRETAYNAFTFTANAYRMYPDRKHTFSDYWAALTDLEAKGGEG